MSSAASPVSSRRTLGRPCAHLLPEIVERRECGDRHIAIFQSFAVNDVHHGEGQRSIGPRTDGVVPVGELAGPVLMRIDRVEACAVAPGFHDEGPEMYVRAENIAAPGDDQFRVPELLGFHAVAHAERVCKTAQSRRAEQMVRSSREAPSR